MPLTLAESMALAVLKGDEAAAYALADRLLEERQADPRKAASERSRLANFATAVYDWPEFRAFMRRLNVPIDLGTQWVEVRVAVDEIVEVRHGYLGQDAGRQPPSGE